MTLQLKVIFVSLLLVGTISAQEQKPLYTGGMLFLQPGYSIAENQYQNIESIGFGLGGFVRFYIKKHFIIGIIGGNQKTNYETTGSVNSYFSLGYGGIFFGYSQKLKRLRLSVAVSTGMGKIKNMHIEKQTGEKISSAYYYAHKTFVAYPVFSLDYSILEKLSAVAQMILLTAHYNKNDLYYCPSFQLGVAFNR